MTRLFALSCLISLAQSIDRNNRIKSTDYVYRIYIYVYSLYADCTAKGANRVRGIKLHSSWKCKSECKSWIDLDPMQCAVYRCLIPAMRSPLSFDKALKHNTNALPLQGAGQQQEQELHSRQAQQQQQQRNLNLHWLKALSLFLSLHLLCESLQSRCLTSNNNSKLYLIRRDP